MRIICTRTLTGFIPKYGSDYELLKKIKIGDDCEAEIKIPRNLQFHRKLFALLQLAFNNQDRYSDFNHLRMIYTMKAGYYEEIKTDKGLVFIPLSISFAKMDQAEFDNFYSKMIDVVIKEIGVTSEGIEKEIINFL